MNMSSEEFFMYLTIALIVVVPVSVRVYRYLTAKQLHRVLREEFGTTAGKGQPKETERRP